MLSQWRIVPSTYKKLAYLTLVGLSIIIVTGAAVRLTQSGLGCPDWPTCSTHHYVAEWRFHPMIEFVNRIITIFCSIAVISAALGAVLLRPFRKDLFWLAMGLVLGIVAEIVLGGITVLEKLAPPFVMAHLMLSLGIVWNALVLYRRASTPQTPTHPVVSSETIWLGRLMTALLIAILFMGTVVTGSGPHSGSPLASRLPFLLRSVAELHADLVLFEIGMTLAMVFLLRQGRASESLQAKGRWLLEIEAIQGIIGYTQYFTHLPALVVEFHVAGATVVWISMLWLNLSFYEREERHLEPMQIPLESVFNEVSFP